MEPETRATVYVSYILCLLKENPVGLVTNVASVAKSVGKAVWNGVKSVGRGLKNGLKRIGRAIFG